MQGNPVLRGGCGNHRAGHRCALTRVTRHDVWPRVFARLQVACPSYLRLCGPAPVRVFRARRDKCGKPAWGEPTFPQAEVGG